MQHLGTANPLLSPLAIPYWNLQLPNITGSHLIVTGSTKKLVLLVTLGMYRFQFNKLQLMANIRDYQFQGTASPSGQKYSVENFIEVGARFLGTQNTKGTFVGRVHRETYRLNC